MKTWNKTCALNISSKMLTDEIMDPIEMKTGDPKKQQRITHHSRRLATRRALRYHNIQEHDTIDQSLELQGGKGETQQSSPQWTQKKLPHTHTIVEQLKYDMGRLVKQSHPSGHDFGKAASRQHRGNTQRHFVFDETRQRYTLRESRSNDRREYERT